MRNKEPDFASPRRTRIERGWRIVVAAMSAMRLSDTPDIHVLLKLGQLRVIDDAVSSCAPSESAIPGSNVRRPTGARSRGTPVRNPAGSTALGYLFSRIGGEHEGLPDLRVLSVKLLAPPQLRDRRQNYHRLH